MPLIRQIGHIDGPQERRSAIATALPILIRLTRAAPGCLRFDVTPDPDVGGGWHVSELFGNRQAFDAHPARAAASKVGAQASAGVEICYRVKEVVG